MAGFAAALEVPLTQQQAERLLAFERLLLDRAIPVGFVSEGDAGRLRTRHILDCLRSAAVVEDEDRFAYDLGSGAGLPGVVVAIARPSLSMALVESRHKRVAFLELVVEELGLENVSALASRVEDVRGPADLCFARALSSAAGTFTLARSLLRDGGRVVYFAGTDFRESQVPPEAVLVRVLRTPVLESSGPLVIMARQ